METATKQTYTLREAAPILGVSVDTVRSSIRLGQIPYIRLGQGRGRLYVLKRPLDELVRTGRDR